MSWRTITTLFMLWLSSISQDIGIMLHQDWAILPVNHSLLAAGYYSPGSHVQTTKCPWQLCLILSQGQSPPVAPWRVRSKGLCTPDTVIWARAVHAALYTWHCACGITYITKALDSGCRERGEESYTGAQMVRTVGVSPRLNLMNSNSGDVFT